MFFRIWIRLKQHCEARPDKTRESERNREQNHSFLKNAKTVAEHEMKINIFCPLEARTKRIVITFFLGRVVFIGSALEDFSFVLERPATSFRFCSFLSFFSFLLVVVAPE